MSRLQRVVRNAVLLLFFVALPAWSWQAQVFDSELIGLEAVGGNLIATRPDGRRMIVEVRGDRLETTPYRKSAIVERPDDMLPDGVVVTGKHDIRRAWLGGPTTRYDHSALGDGVEASRLHVVDQAGKRYLHELPGHYVFEDRYPRLVDLDGGGTEVIVIRSDIRKGAGVAVYTLRNGALREVAAAEPIGMSHRWLNIVGTADFDGDGRKEIATVVTPHIGGTLSLLRRRGDKLLPVFQRRGFSNHAYGSRELGMAAVLDLNGDGLPDIAVPDAQREALVLLTLAGGVYRELDRIEHPASVDSDIHAIDLTGTSGFELVYLLADHSLVVVSR